MICGELERRRIDDTFTEMVEGFCPDLRVEATHLPYRLGLTRHPRGAWEDFVVMSPNRDLPRYAAEDPARPGKFLLSTDSIDAFRRAHHCAAIYGLVTDRLADCQVERDEGLVRLRGAVREAWETALAWAMGSRPRARGIIGTSLRSLRWGNRREREALERACREGEGVLSCGEYAALTRAKLRWFGTASHGLLLSLDQAVRAAALRRAYDTFSFALQCLDDALDEESDRAVRGMSFPGALGLPVGGLLAAVPLLMGRAARLAADAHFHALSAWLERVSKLFEGRPLLGNPIRNAIAASVLESAVE